MSGGTSGYPGESRRRRSALAVVKPAGSGKDENYDADHAAVERDGTARRTGLEVVLVDRREHLKQSPSLGPD